MNILFQNLQKPSLYFKNSCQKKNFKFKFKTKLLWDPEMKKINFALDN